MNTTTTPESIKKLRQEYEEITGKKNGKFLKEKDLLKAIGESRITHDEGFYDLYKDLTLEELKENSIKIEKSIKNKPSIHIGTVTGEHRAVLDDKYVPYEYAMSEYYKRKVIYDLMQYQIYKKTCPQL